MLFLTNLTNSLVYPASSFVARDASFKLHQIKLIIASYIGKTMYNSPRLLFSFYCELINEHKRCFTLKEMRKYILNEPSAIFILSSRSLLVNYFSTKALRAI